MCGGFISFWGGSVEIDVSDGVILEVLLLVVNVFFVFDIVKYFYMYCL